MAYSNSCSHPLDQHFTLLLSSLPLDDFTDHYRGKINFSMDDNEILYSNSVPSTRRYKINHLVKIAKEKDPYLKNFLWALKMADQPFNNDKDSDLYDKLASATKEFSESKRETDITSLTRSLSSVSLNNYNYTVDVESHFTRICCGGCTTSNTIGDTADFMDFYKRTNPHGYIHRFYTIQGISSDCRIKREGTWHYEHTWFEKFWWMIINCAHCDLHWGWHFENKDGSEGFYGIRKDVVCLRAKK